MLRYNFCHSGGWLFHTPEQLKLHQPKCQCGQSFVARRCSPADATAQGDGVINAKGRTFSHWHRASSLAARHRHSYVSTAVSLSRLWGRPALSQNSTSGRLLVLISLFVLCACTLYKNSTDILRCSN